MAQKIKPEFVQCKGTRRHQWFVTDVERRSSFGTPVWHMCELCTTVRKTIINIYGEIAARWYTYPEGYKGTEITAASFRLAEVKQFRAAQRRAKEKSLNT